MAGCTEKTEGWVGGLHKKVVRRTTEKCGAGCRKGPALRPAFSAAQPTVQPALMCSPLACRVVQPAGPFCAARHPAENSCFSFGNMTLQPARPAGPPFTVIPNLTRNEKTKKVRYLCRLGYPWPQWKFALKKFSHIMIWQVYHTKFMNGSQCFYREQIW